MSRPIHPSRQFLLAGTVWLAGLVLAVFVVWHTAFTTDMSAFLPRSPTAAQKVLVEQLRDGVFSRLIFVGIEHAPADRLAEVSRTLAESLRQDGRFVAVHNGQDVGVSRDRDVLWTHRYLLSSAVTAEHFRAPALRAALENDMDLLGSPAGALTKRILAHDPTGEVLQLIERFSGTAEPSRRDGVWFAKSGERALLVIQTKAAGFDIDAQQAALLALDDAFKAAAAKAGVPEARLLETGAGVISVHTREKIKKDASRLSLIATLVVSMVLLSVYRSVRVVVLALLPVVSGALAGIAAVSLGFGSVHGITLGFGSTLIGEAVDYAIYLFTQTPPGSRPELTLPRIWPTLRLGVLTSICGFSALLFSSFTGLAQLGLFSIAGLLVAVSVTRWILPGLLPSGFAASGATLLAPLVGLLVARNGRWRAALALLVLCAIAVIATRPTGLWDERLTSLSPTSAEEQSLNDTLERDIAAPDLGYLLVINASGEQDALLTAEALAAPLDALIGAGALKSYDSPADVLPSVRAQRSRQAALPEAQVLRDNLAQALTGLPFQTDLFAPFLEDVSHARTEALLERADLEGTNLALKLDSLLIRHGGEWVAMLPLHGVTDPGRIREAIGARAPPGVVLLDLKGESDQLYHTYLRQALFLALLGCAAITLLLAASLRSWRRSLQVLAPLAASVLVTTALLLVSDGRLTIFHLIGLLLVVAVGSNYALFFEGQQFAGRREERTVASLALANICTVIGFGTLAFSGIPVLHGIGMTVAIGAVLCLVFSAWCTRPQRAVPRV